MLGALIGQLYSVVLTVPFPNLALQPGTAAIAALAALGTGVLGAPFSMICLALEITGDFSVTVGAVVASSVCALIVRELFGYSFATWRFHLRGEVIRGPQDVGWVQQLSASSLMRADFENALSTMPIAEAQKLFSPARVRQIVLRDPNGTYAGLVSSADLHSIATKTTSRSRLWRSRQEEFLLPRCLHSRDHDRVRTQRSRRAGRHRSPRASRQRRDRQRGQCLADLWRGVRAAQSGTVLQMSGALTAADPCRSGRNRRDR